MVKNMMVDFNVGIDCERVARFSNLTKNDIFIKKHFTKQEINYCYAKTKPQIHIAGFFCAKEAVIKTHSSKLDFKDMEISHDKNGKPIMKVKNSKKKYELSITHTDDLAIALVVAVK